MKKEKFFDLPRMKDEDDLKKLEIGDKFLYGDRMVAQIETKIAGQEISMFEILNKKENSVEYVLVFDKLE